MAPVEAGALPGESRARPAALFLRHLLLDRRWYWTFVPLWLLGEAVLSGLIIRFIPYTNIDWTAYMQQVSMFRAGERDYARIEGDTGYLVYPALHLYIYTALEILLPGKASCPPYLPSHSLDPVTTSSALDCHTSPEQIRAAQLVWAGVWVVTCGLVAWICWMAGSGGVSERTKGKPRDGTVVSDQDGSRGRDDHVPQVILPFLSLSKRLHSIYVLRLFNDPLAMLFLYAAVVLLQRGRWTAGSVIFSLGLGIKMNVLLFLPGLLVLLVQYTGIRRTAGHVGVIALIQILLPMPFFLSSPHAAQAYFGRAFNFARGFLYKWSVNWAWLDEAQFLSGRFSRVLLGGHLVLLVLFAWFRWSSIVPGGTREVLRRALARWHEPPVPFGPGSAFHIAHTLFTSNMVGIFFARSLHYQFFSWYAHQLPFLLWAAWRSGANGAAMTVRYGIAQFVAFVAIQYAWNAFPPSMLASAGLWLATGWLIGGAWLSKERIGGGLLAAR